CAGATGAARARARTLRDAPLGVRRSLPPQPLLPGARLHHRDAAARQRRDRVPRRGVLASFRRLASKARSALRRSAAASRRDSPGAAARLYRRLLRRRALLLRERRVLRAAADRLRGRGAARSRAAGAAADRGAGARGLVLLRLGG